MDERINIFRVVCIFSLLVAIAGTACADDEYQLTPKELAENIAKYYAEETWGEINISQPTLYYDLDGNPAVYVFEVIKSGGIIGTVVTGATDAHTPIVEMYGGPPLHVDINSNKTRDLAFSLLGSIKSEVYVYPQPFDYWVKYSNGTRSVVVSLVSGEVIPLNLSNEIKNLKPFSRETTHKEEIKKEWDQIMDKKNTNFSHPYKKTKTIDYNKVTECLKQKKDLNIVLPPQENNVVLPPQENNIPQQGDLRKCVEQAITNLDADNSKQSGGISIMSGDTDPAESSGDFCTNPGARCVYHYGVMDYYYSPANNPFDNIGCVPRSAAMILDYWDDTHYPNIITNSYTSNDLIYDLKVKMKTDGNGYTLPENIPTGIKDVLLKIGYNNTFTGVAPGCYPMTNYCGGDDFNNVLVSEINNERPVMYIAETYYYGNTNVHAHAMAAIGYTIENSTKYVIVHDPAGRSGANQQRKMSYAEANDHQYVKIIPTMSSYSIALRTDWNLISIPITSKNPSIKSVLSSIEGKYTKVSAQVNGIDVYYIPGFPFNTLNEINEEMGVWIKMNQSATLTVEGYIPEDRKINLRLGWNLVGYLSTKKTQPLETALSSINGKYTKVGAWINGTGKNYIPGFPFNTLVYMSEGYGYWIETNTACVLEYA